MNLAKSREFFDPSLDETRISIIGCGSVGSSLAELFARCGLTNIDLYDFDNVCSHNIHNQMFRASDIGRPKVEALKDILVEINPDLAETVRLKPKGWQGRLLPGYIFLAVDSIELRRKFVEAHMNSPYVRAVFDIRTGLTGAQHYAADWSILADRENLLKGMQFSHEEAAAETPVSACGVTLGVVTTVRLITALAVNNFIRYSKGEGLWHFVEIDGFTGMLDCF